MIQDLFSMDNKICVVTGGSSGLGSYDYFLSSY